MNFAGRAVNHPPDLRAFFHRLNNQLGIVLAHAELLEAKAADASSRARAAQIVSSVLDAMGSVRDLHTHLLPPAADAQ
jgi:hypothetical protein